MAITVKGGTRFDAATAAPAEYDYSTYSYGAYGTYKPDIASSGLPVGTRPSDLTVITGNSSGDYVITDAVAAAVGHWDLVWFDCRVIVKTSAQLLFTRFFMEGKPLTTVGSTGCLDLNQNTGTNYNVLLRDGIIRAKVPSVGNNGIVGHDFDVQRCNFYNVVDGIQLGSTLSGGNANGILRGNYIHDLAYFSPDAYMSGGVVKERQNTHNDCVQWMGGANFTTRGNHFDARMNPSLGAAQFAQASRNPVIGGGPNNPYAVSSDPYGYSANYPNLAVNSCFQINAGTGPLSGWDSDSDWFSGGGYQIHADATIGGACTNGRFIRNFLFGPIAAPAPGVSATVTTDFTGCVYDDNGASVLPNIYRGP